MSLKQEIETWVEALEFYDKQEYETALSSFGGIADTSKILFNCGVIHATLGEHDRAVEFYQKAVQLDKYLAVAYFQQGVSNFLVGDFEEALANFNDTLLYLRGNHFIDYEQLGLKFRLYSCEALFNRGLCYIYLQERDAGMNDLIFAAKEKETEDHDVIDEAIKEQAEGYTVFSIPVGVVYRPNASKVKNLKTKDYLGKARLIASTDKFNTTTNFFGADQAEKEKAAALAAQEREKEKVSYAAANLVRPDLQSRSRQQSEPPLGRNIYPPTPPPEEASRAPSTVMMSSARSIAPSESISLSSRANSVRAGTAAYKVSRGQNAGPPPRGIPEDEIDDSIPSMGSPPSSMRSQQRPRLANIRTGSEPPRRAQTFDDGNYGPGRNRDRNEGFTSPNGRQPLYGEVVGSPENGDYDDVASDVYDLYSKTANQNPYQTSKGSQRREPSRTRGREPTSTYPNDSDGMAPSGRSSVDDFEMLNGNGPNRARGQSSSRQPTRQQSLPMHTRGSSYGGQQASGMSGEVKSIRVKLRMADEARYLMVNASTEFDEFEQKSKEKLKLKKGIKIKMRDAEDPSGDLITVGDPEDWEMAMDAARSEAKRAGDEVGRLEVWISEIGGFLS